MQVRKNSAQVYLVHVILQPHSDIGIIQSSKLAKGAYYGFTIKREISCCYRRQHRPWSGICEVLAEEGMNIIVNYIYDPKEADSFAKKLSGKAGTNCVAMYVDISKTDDIDKIFSDAEKEFGQVDVLVNNAGIWPTTMVEKCKMPSGRKLLILI